MALSSAAPGVACATAALASPAQPLLHFFTSTAAPSPLAGLPAFTAGWWLPLHAPGLQFILAAAIVLLDSLEGMRWASCAVLAGGEATEALERKRWLQLHSLGANNWAGPPLSLELQAAWPRTWLRRTDMSMTHRRTCAVRSANRLASSLACLGSMEKVAAHGRPRRPPLPCSPGRCKPGGRCLQQLQHHRILLALCGQQQRGVSE